jgi:hypothetical protein
MEYGEYRVLTDRGLCLGLKTRPEESYRGCCVSVIEEPHRGGVDPLGLSSHDKKKSIRNVIVDNVSHVFISA